MPLPRSGYTPFAPVAFTAAPPGWRVRYFGRPTIVPLAGWLTIEDEDGGRRVVPAITDDFGAEPSGEIVPAHHQYGYAPPGSNWGGVLVPGVRTTAS